MLGNGLDLYDCVNHPFFFSFVHHPQQLEEWWHHCWEQQLPPQWRVQDDRLGVTALRHSTITLHQHLLFYTCDTGVAKR